MFIVLEGVDGSGKSTQAKLLFENLKKANPDREVILTREPGGSKGAEEIRKLILGGTDANRWSPETELLLFNAARRDHVEKTIRPVLERGGIVVCDRFVGSTLSYQGVKNPHLKHTIQKLHDLMIDINPDLTIVVDRPDGDRSVDAREMDRMEISLHNKRSHMRRALSELMLKDKTWYGVFASDMDNIASKILETVIKIDIMGHDEKADRVFMDEDYLRTLGEANDRTPGDDIKNRKDDLILFGRDEENPFITGTYMRREGGGYYGHLTPFVHTLPISFMDISKEEAETIIWEKIEADLPHIMDIYSGANIGSMEP